MTHECPECGELCDCDKEDIYWDEAPDDCSHDCAPEIDDYEED